MAPRPQLPSSSKQPAAAAPAAVPQRAVRSGWWRLVGAGAVALLLGLGGLALLWLLARPLALLVLSIALAEALDPAVQRLGRWLPRGAAILLLYSAVLLVLGFVIALQQLENNLLVPNIMRSQTDVSPLLVLVAIFAGSSVGGVLGALVAVPLSAALRVLACQELAPAIRRRTGAAPLEQSAQP